MTFENGPTACRQTGTSRAVDELSRMVDEVDNALGDLRDRLLPVFSPIPNEAAKAPKGAEVRKPSAPLVNGIDEVTDSLRLTAGRVREIIERLEV